MRIGIDGRLFLRNTTGQERYVSSLCSHLKAMECSRSSYTLYTKTPFPQMDRLRPRFSECVAGSAAELVAELFHENQSIDVYHLPWGGSGLLDSLLLLLMPRSIYTPPNLVLYKNPDYFPDTPSHERYKLMVCLSAHWANKIIAVSRFSKRDIVETLSLPSEKVVVIRPGADSKFKPIDDRSRLDKVRKKYGITGRLILSAETQSPHNNAENLIRAFSELQKREDQRLQLVIAGQRYGQKESQEINRILSHVDHRESIQLLNHPPDDDLVALYNLADVFVNPSLFDNFGLSALEAMACGTPVVSSNAASLPEIGGDSALSIDTRDVAEIVRAVRELLYNRQLKEKLVEKGFARICSFSMEKTAEQTHSVYQDVYRQYSARRVDSLPRPLKQWFVRHANVAAEVEKEIVMLSRRRDHTDGRLAKFSDSMPGKIYTAAFGAGRMEDEKRRHNGGGKI